MGIKATRIKACELAAQCLGREIGAGGAVAGRLFSLIIFFETYIEEGGDETQKRMRLLDGRKSKKLRIIAGGDLNRAPH